MSSKKEKINEFLYFFRDIAIQNPNHTFNKKEVYHALTHIGVPENEKRIDDNFSTWIKYFNENNKIDVFVSEKWKYFCQFISTDQKAKHADEHIKIYVPLDSDHIKRGAIEIFEFLTTNNISHLSKIGSNTRFDDIVIRIINPKEINLIINFLEKNQYIQEGLMTANPFTFNINGIPMAIDGKISYNSTIATLITLYINDKKYNNSLETVNVEDFYNYIKNYNNYVFSSKEGIEKLKNDFELKNNELTTLVNYKNVFKLIIETNNNNFTINDYINHYYECSNPRTQKEKEQALEELINQKKSISKEFIQENYALISKTNKMLIETIKIMTEKYNNQQGILINIYNYIIKGDECYITRYKDLRNKITNSSFRKDLTYILENTQTSFMTYVDKLLLEERKNEKESINNTNRISYSTLEKEVILTVQEILKIMSNKYGNNVAYNNLNNYILTGKANYLTKEQNLRERITNSNFRYDLKNILNERNLNLNEYLNFITNTNIIKNDIFLEKAILETYTKYENKFLEGTSQMSGKDFVIASLIKLIKENKYTGFTRNNNARNNLQNNVSKTETINIIKKEMGIENNTNIPDSNIINYIENYVNKILENNFTKKI